MKKVLFIFLLLIASIIIFLLNKNSVKKETIQIKKEVLIVQEGKEPIIKKEVLITKKEIKPIVKEEKVNVKEKSHYEELMTISEDERFKRAHKNGIRPLLSVNINKKDIKNLFINDTFDLPEIDGNIYTLEINERFNNNDIISLKASIEGLDGDSYAIITEGENTTFMTIKTPEGLFEVEIFGNSGYIYSAKDIQNTWVDFTKKDTITIPPKKEN